MQEIAPMPDASYGPAPETATEEPKPKRGPGRPPKDPNAPKRTYTRRTTAKKSLENDIAQMLLMFNFIFGWMPEPWNGDAFTDDEIQALSQALNAFALDHARVYKYLQSMMVGGNMSSVTLVLVIGKIVQRRLDNHGVDTFKLLGISRGQDGDNIHAVPAE